MKKKDTEALWVYLFRIFIGTIPIYILAIIFRCCGEIGDIFSNTDWFKRKAVK